MRHPVPFFVTFSFILFIFPSHFCCCHQRKVMLLNTKLIFVVGFITALMAAIGGALSDNITNDTGQYFLIPLALCQYYWWFFQESMITRHITVSMLARCMNISEMPQLSAMTMNNRGRCLWRVSVDEGGHFAPVPLGASFAPDMIPLFSLLCYGPSVGYIGKSAATQGC